ncbi:transposase, partial [Psychrobacillus sp. MER TA 171]|uniref:transposase n=1 Tax=Psychrobacillus sp. MER TA 171 TaxID=2939577 RepID=UPI00203D93A1
KDGLSGFTEAIQSTFPKTHIQLCVIHQLRNTMKYVPSRERNPFMTDLKKVYKASTLEQAELEVGQVKASWKDKYPKVIGSWEEHW